ncbi:hypothetical protein BN126_2449 [Cronobacter sakazakii 680]|nr:hypothetical protein BN126_2449 [Cronobacter sakazakii 680]
MTVHDALYEKTRLTGQLHTLKNPPPAGFLLFGQGKDE